MNGWYYLHAGGDVIWKGAAYTSEDDLRSSDFVVAYWPFREGDREWLWMTLVEATALGADAQAVARFAEKNGANDTDAHEFCKRIDVTVAREGSGWFVVPTLSARRAVAASLADEPLPPAVVGRGPTVLAALADLAKASGWAPAAKSGGTFPAHLTRQEATV